jgi:isochorismate hydrolase
MPLIAGGAKLIWNIRRLMDGANLLEVPTLGTEQYPRGLGPTVPELRDATIAWRDKSTFSSCGCESLFAELVKLNRPKVVVCGIESHVCVTQTSLDLLAAGYRVYLAVDAVGSRGTLDYETALRRLDSCGATLTTVESVLFEWCGDSANPAFKSISQLIRQTPPE